MTNTHKCLAVFICIVLVSATGLVGCKAEPMNGMAANSKAALTNTDNRTPTTPAADAKGQVQIVIQNFAFAPSEITVEPGTKVTWVNKDDAPHTATSVDNKFNSGGLDTDDTYSFVFKDKGDYQYFCTLHPQMKAIIKVK